MHAVRGESVRVPEARSSWRTLFLLLALSMVLLPGGAWAQDAGDAPDGASAGYPVPQDGVIGNFPTLNSTGNSRYGLPGANTSGSGDAHLGPSVSTDNGVSGSYCPVSATGPFNQVTLTLKVTIPASSSPGPWYVNVLVDQNRDGVWSNGTRLRPEALRREFGALKRHSLREAGHGRPPLYFQHGSRPGAGSPRRRPQVLAGPSFPVGRRARGRPASHHDSLRAARHGLAAHGGCLDPFRPRNPRLPSQRSAGSSDQIWSGGRGSGRVGSPS